jgi:Uma2 family endonuclease
MGLATQNFQSLAITPDRWSLERYHQAVKAGIFEGQPVELLDGQLIQMAPEGFPMLD